MDNRPDKSSATVDTLGGTGFLIGAFADFSVNHKNPVRRTTFVPSHHGNDDDKQKKRCNAYQNYKIVIHKKDSLNGY
jgi:hypothetical protein